MAVKGAARVSMGFGDVSIVQLETGDGVMVCISQAEPGAIGLADETGREEHFKAGVAIRPPTDSVVYIESATPESVTQLIDCLSEYRDRIAKEAT